MPQFTFRSTIIHWRGPSPYFFAPIPAEHVEAVRKASKLVSYGWGVIPVEAVVAGTTFTTSLFPKDEGYLLPLKDKVRKACGFTAGDEIAVEMSLKPKTP